jgi:hypothetical protein
VALHNRNISAVVGILHCVTIGPLDSSLRYTEQLHARGNAKLAGEEFLSSDTQMQEPFVSLHSTATTAFNALELDPWTANQTSDMKSDLLCPKGACADVRVWLPLPLSASLAGWQRS